MNCECIYFSKGADANDLHKLAKVITNFDGELYPVAISALSETWVCEDYDGRGNKTKIPNSSLVLFAAGKYHYMYPIRLGRRVFHPWFPVDHDIHYEDICEF